MGVLGDFQKLKIWGWNYFLPVFMAPKNSVEMVVFFYLWPLSSFLPFPSLKRGVAKKPCFIAFVCPPFYNLVVTCINNHQNKKCKRQFFHPFLKTRQKATITLHPPLKTWFTKMLWNHYFIERNDVEHLLTQYCGSLIGPKTPKWVHLLTLQHLHEYIYIYICMYVCMYVLAGPM